MYCSKCGAKAADGASYCASCGAPLNTQDNRSAQGPERAGWQQSAYESYSQPVQQGMKWHKFLVYFSLWFSAIANLWNGIQAITGQQYKGNAETVYRELPGMKLPDVVFGILCIVTAVLLVITAVSLLKFKANGPKMLTLAYAVSVIACLIYVIWAAVILSGKGVDVRAALSSTFMSLAISVIMIFVNRNYYQKRAHLFVN